MTWKRTAFLGPLRKLMCWCVKITKRYPDQRLILIQSAGKPCQPGALRDSNIFQLFLFLRAIEKPWKWYPSWFIYYIFRKRVKISPTFFFCGSRTSPQSGYWWTNHTVNQNQQVSSGIMGWKKNGVIRPEIRRLPCHQICALQRPLPDLFEATDVRRPFGEVLQLNSKFYSWLVVSNICYFP